MYIYFYFIENNVLQALYYIMVPYRGTEYALFLISFYSILHVDRIKNQFGCTHFPKDLSQRNQLNSLKYILCSCLLPI